MKNLLLLLLSLPCYANLTVITGPMYSGKTKELIRIVELYRIIGHRVLVAKYSQSHGDAEFLKSRGTPVTIPAIPIKTASELQDVYDGHEVLAIDEVQFFHPAMALFLDNLRSQGKNVVVSGLDTDFKKEPFGECMPELLRLADTVKHFKAICNVCHRHNATLSQRLRDGKPVSRNDDLVAFEGMGNVTYEPRCADCHILLD